MALEIFLAPMTSSVQFGKTIRHPPLMFAADVEAYASRYSHTGACVVLFNAPQAYLDTVRAQPGVTSLATPANIDNVLSAAQADVAQAILDGYGIPSSFVNAGDTRRMVIRVLLGLFDFSSRTEGLTGTCFRDWVVQLEVTLDTPWSGFPMELKDVFAAARDSFGFTNMNLTAASTLRQMLREVARQFETTPMHLGRVTI